MSTHKFEIPIGDWSHDGHGKCDYFTVESSEPLSYVNELYESAKQIHPDLNPEEFCNDYEDSVIPENVYKRMKLLGFDVERHTEKCYNDPENRTIYPIGMAVYVCWFISLMDKNLKLEVKDTPNRLEINGQIGYGLFN